MNTNYKRVPTRFGPETRFEVRPASLAPFRATQETELERLKNRLLLKTLKTKDWRFNAHVRRAANEAAALAWVTPYPLLVFPELFDERVEAALFHARRQDEVRRRSRELLAL